MEDKGPQMTLSWSYTAFFLEKNYHWLGCANTVSIEGQAFHWEKNWRRKTILEHISGKEHFSARHKLTQKHICLYIEVGVLYLECMTMLLGDRGDNNLINKNNSNTSCHSLVALEISWFSASASNNIKGQSNFQRGGEGDDIPYVKHESPANILATPGFVLWVIFWNALLMYAFSMYAKLSNMFFCAVFIVIYLYKNVDIVACTTHVHISGASGILLPMESWELWNVYFYTKQRNQHVCFPSLIVSCRGSFLCLQNGTDY